MIDIQVYGVLQYYGLDQVEKGGLTFKFMNSTLSLNDTTHARGQIPGIIYCLSILFYPITLEGRRGTTDYHWAEVFLEEVNGQGGRTL